MHQEYPVHSNMCGHWRIVWMELWDEEYIHCVVPGYIHLDSNGRGEFQFGVVTGFFHYGSSKASFDGKWEGEDEGDEVLGEIDGMIEMVDGKTQLHGTISFWNGDESDYKAIRVD